MKKINFIGTIEVPDNYTLDQIEDEIRSQLHENGLSVFTYTDENGEELEE